MKAGITIITLGAAAGKLLIPVRFAEEVVVSMPNRSSSSRAAGAVAAAVVVAAASDEANAEKSSSPPSSSNLSSFSAGAGFGAAGMDDAAEGRLGIGTDFVGLVATLSGGGGGSLCTVGSDILSFDI
jgi:hypothetical protein